MKLIKELSNKEFEAMKTRVLANKTNADFMPKSAINKSFKLTRKWIKTVNKEAAICKKYLAGKLSPAKFASLITTENISVEDMNRLNRFARANVNPFLPLYRYEDGRRNYDVDFYPMYDKNDNFISTQEKLDEYNEQRKRKTQENMIMISSNKKNHQYINVKFPYLSTIGVQYTELENISIEHRNLGWPIVANKKNFEDRIKGDILFEILYYYNQAAIIPQLLKAYNDKYYSENIPCYWFKPCEFSENPLPGYEDSLFDNPKCELQKMSCANLSIVDYHTYETLEYAISNNIWSKKVYVLDVVNEFVKKINNNEEITKEEAYTSILAACIPCEYNLVNTIAYLVYNREPDYEKKCKEIVDFAVKFNADMYKELCDKISNIDICLLVNELKKCKREINTNDSTYIVPQYIERYYNKYALGLGNETLGIESEGKSKIDSIEAKGYITDKMKELDNFCTKYAPLDIIKIPTAAWFTNDKYLKIVKQATYNWKKLNTPHLI